MRSPEQFTAAFGDVELQPLHGDVLRSVNEVAALPVVATLALVPQLPSLLQFLRPAVDQWRAGPAARGAHG